MFKSFISLLIIYNALSEYRRLCMQCYDKPFKKLTKLVDSTLIFIYEESM